MKKTMILSTLIMLVITTLYFWFINDSSSAYHWQRDKFIMASGIFLVLAFSAFILFKRVASLSRGEPIEDELSKKIMQKTSSISYYVSLYWWLFVMYISDSAGMETHTVIGLGILGMAIIFVLSWGLISFRGIKE